MIYPVEYFSAKCDCCGAEWCDNHYGITAYGEKEQMSEALMNDEWHKGEDGEHYCPDCFYFGDQDELVVKWERNKTEGL